MSKEQIEVIFWGQIHGLHESNGCEWVNEGLASGSPRVLSSCDQVLRIRQGGVCG